MSATGHSKPGSTGSAVSVSPVPNCCAVPSAWWATTSPASGYTTRARRTPGLQPHAGFRVDFRLRIVGRNDLDYQVGDCFGIAAARRQAQQPFVGRKRVIGSPHRVRVVLYPNPGFGADGTTQAVQLHEIADPPPNAVCNFTMTVTSWRHYLQFPPHQFIPLAVIRERQQVVGGNRFFGCGHSEALPASGLADPSSRTV